MPADCPWCAADGPKGCPDHVDGHLWRAIAAALTIEVVVCGLVLLAIFVATR